MVVVVSSAGTADVPEGGHVVGGGHAAQGAHGAHGAQVEGEGEGRGANVVVPTRHAAQGAQGAHVVGGGEVGGESVAGAVGHAAQGAHGAHVEGEGVLGVGEDDVVELAGGGHEEVGEEVEVLTEDERTVSSAAMVFFCSSIISFRLPLASRSASTSLTRSPTS